MKNRKNELNVDVIGGLGALTKEDEKAISNFIQARKQKLSDRKKSRLAKQTNRTKTTQKA